jgi:YaiO family outer membrane protein
LARRGLALRPKDADYQAALEKVQAYQKRSSPTPATRPDFQNEPNWETGLAQSNIFYSDHRSTWHETSATLSRNTSAGWITARFSHANWFGESSNLIELESYPKIRPGTYGYLEGAFSPDATLYAKRRFGAEIFQSFPKGFEGSAGMRYMRFGTKDTILYTGSVGKYFGNWWVLGRTFVTPDSIFGASKSLQVSGRRYFKDADHFLGVRIGVGASPFEIRSVNEYDVQKSTSAAFESLWRMKNGLRFRITTGAARQTRLGLVPLWQFQADGTVYFQF